MDKAQSQQIKELLNPTAPAPEVDTDVSPAQSDNAAVRQTQSTKDDNISELLHPEDDTDVETITDEANDAEVVDESSEEDKETESDEGETGEVIFADSPADPYTIKSLSDATEVSQKDLYNIQIALDDDQGNMSLGDLKNGYQDIVRERDELNKTIEAQQTKLSGDHVSYNQQEIVAQVEFQAINDAFTAIDWAELEEIDPASAVLQKQKLQERYMKASGAMQQANQQRIADHDEYMVGAQAKMIELIPAWKDDTVKLADMKDINTELLKAGYPQEHINSIDDPIVYSLMNELVKLRKEKATGKKLVKKVVKKPRTLKTTVTTKAGKLTEVQKAVAAAKNTEGMSPTQIKQAKQKAVNAILQNSRR